MESKKLEKTPLKSRFVISVHNMSQIVGWSICLSLVLYHSCINKDIFFPVYSIPLLQRLVQVFQCLQLFDVLFALAKLTRTNPLNSLIQVASRVFIVFGSLDLYVKYSRASFLIFAWSLAEIVRYSYYLNLEVKVGALTRFLTWLRYSAFIVLYPLGFSHELISLWEAREVFRALDPVIGMPNFLNFHFEYRIFCLYFYSPVSIPLFLKLYCYMFVQRKRVLSKGKSRQIEENLKKE